MQAYIVAFAITFIFLLLAALISNAIKFEGGSRPRDPQQRKTWFWILALLNPATIFLMGYFIFIPDGNLTIVNNYVSGLAIGTGIGFVLYIIAGFILSKLFKNGKLGHWF